MKIISLNTWGGQLYEPLKAFISAHAHDTDIFCLQEVNHGADPKEVEAGTHPNFFVEFLEILPDHIGYFTPQVTGIGMATFVKKNLNVEEYEDYIVLKGEEISRLRNQDGIKYYPRAMQKIKIDGNNFYNFHGVPGGNKVDCPERDLQTEVLLKIFVKDNGTRVLVGDFNLNLGTNAHKTIAGDMQDLISEQKVKTTRSHHYKKIDSQPHADFAFVTKDIPVKNFEVLSDVVSDHLPLLLEI